MKKDVRVKFDIFCGECESDFTISHWEVSVMGEPKHCPFCGEEITEDQLGKEPEDVIEEEIDEEELEE